MNNNSVLNSPWSHHVAVQNERRENKYDNTFALLSLLFVVNAKTKKQFVERGHLWLVRLRVSPSKSVTVAGDTTCALLVFVVDAGETAVGWRSWWVWCGRWLYCLFCCFFSHKVNISKKTNRMFGSKF